MNIFNKIADKYFQKPIICDIVIVGIVWWLSKNIAITSIFFTDKVSQINLLSNIIATNVTLAGFILAALTIIVTFKSNLKAKGMDDAQNALEMIFSSRHYFNIVTVFKKAIVELIICFLVLYISWGISDNLSIRTINRLNSAGILITGLTIARSMYILFTILDLESIKNEE